MSLEPKGSAVSRSKFKKQESAVHTPPHTRRIHVCMHVLYVCIYSMYVLYVRALCLHSMCILYVCTLCLCRERAFQQIAEAAVRAVWAHECVAPTPTAARSSSFSGPAGRNGALSREAVSQRRARRAHEP